MTDFNPNGSSMYFALQDFYPMVTPSMEFVGNLFKAFEAEVYPNRHVTERTWTLDLQKWLPSKVGLLRDPVDVNWVKFRVVDEKLYTLALLRYS